MPFLFFFPFPFYRSQRAFQDGYFHTGDIVQVEKSRSVRVIDRKKDIFKLAQGEYVSPVRCETVFQTSKFVEQVFVHGDSLHSYLIGVVVPNQGVLVRWAEENNLPQRDFQELCQLREVNELILAGASETSSIPLFVKPRVMTLPIRLISRFEGCCAAAQTTLVRIRAQDLRFRHTV